MKKIIVTIDEAGDSSVDLQGFHGQGCAQVLQDFSGGDKATKIEKKREYFEKDLQQKQGVRQ